MRKIKKICLIEDDPIASVLSRSFIEHANQVENILIYSNGKEAYHGLKKMYEDGQDLPEIILVDINMPVWDGWEFLEEFNKLGVEKNIVFYILTSSLSPSDYEMAKKFGLEDRYLEKPLNLERVTKILK